MLFHYVVIAELCSAAKGWRVPSRFTDSAGSRSQLVRFRLPPEMVAGVLAIQITW